MKLEGKLTPPKGKDKYWGVSISVIGLHTQGKSKSNALAMAADAIELLVDKPGFKVSCEKGKENDFLVSAEDTATFLAFILSRIRTESNLTAREAALALNSPSPNAYARYEQGRAVPRLDTLEELIHAVNPALNLVLRVG